MLPRLLGVFFVCGYLYVCDCVCVCVCCVWFVTMHVKRHSVGGGAGVLR
jgi:hypothetical protein